jgi:hypothetical protein
VKNLFGLFILIGIFNSCIKHGGNDAGGAHLGVWIRYVDSSGKDLFDPYNNGQNGYWVDSIKIYDITNAKTPLHACFETGFPYQFQVLNVLSLNICENLDFIDRYSYTLINLKEGIYDTLKVHIDQETVGPSTNNDKVWYNGILKPYDSIGNIKVVK